jgi:Ca2+-transporting ATPase
MAAGTLLIFDAAMPGGWIEGPGGIEYGRTMAFTTLMLFQVFNAFNARSPSVACSATAGFGRPFRCRWVCTSWLSMFHFCKPPLGPSV